MNRLSSSKGVLVCFVGIDGSGKSTLARSLSTMMEQRGIECEYVWGGFNDSFTVFRPFVATMKGTLFRNDRFMETSTTKGRVVESSVLSTTYQYLVLADYIFQSSLRVRLPLALGKNVVCDRYVYDLMVAVGVLLDYPMERMMALLDRCLGILSKPDLVFLVDLPEELAFQRKDDVLSLDFLSVRRDLYLRMAQHYGMTVLDGASDPGRLAQLAASEVFRHVAGKP